MANSLEYSVENFFIAIFAADSRSAGKQLLHFDKAEMASSNAIVFQAKQGAEFLPADPGCSEVEVVIEYRSPGKTSEAERDQGAALLHQAVYSSPLTTMQKTTLMTAAGLSKILIPEGASSDRQNTSDLRKRTLTLPVVAKLA